MSAAPLELARSAVAELLDYIRLRENIVPDRLLALAKAGLGEEITDEQRAMLRDFGFDV